MWGIIDGSFSNLSDPIKLWTCIFHDQIGGPTTTPAVPFHIPPVHEPMICKQLCVLVTQITMRGVLLPMVSSCCQFSINNFGHTSNFSRALPNCHKRERGEEKKSITTDCQYTRIIKFLGKILEKYD